MVDSVHYCTRSGEVDFDKFFLWISLTRKHSRKQFSRKLAKAMSDFGATKALGVTRQERPYGRPTGQSLHAIQIQPSFERKEPFVLELN